METELKGTHTPGPVSLIPMDSIIELARLKGEPAPPSYECHMRQNDGSWAISTPDEAIANVRCKATAPRGKAHCSPDPIGESNARLLAASYTSYDKHFGPRAVEAAEKDMLSRIAKSFLAVMDSLGALSNPSALDGHGLNEEEQEFINETARELQALLAMIQKPA